MCVGGGGGQGGLRYYLHKFKFKFNLLQKVLSKEQIIILNFISNLITF